MTDDRECLTCSRCRLTLAKLGGVKCETYDVLVWCRRDPGRARRVEWHDTCEQWKGFDDDGGKDDGE